MDAAGRQRRWDMVKSHSSVGIVLYHAAQDALLVVRQFRPAVSPPDLSLLLAVACVLHRQRLDPEKKKRPAAVGRTLFLCLSQTRSQRLGQLVSGCLLRGHASNSKLEGCSAGICIQMDGGTGRGSRATATLGRFHIRAHSRHHRQGQEQCRDCKRGGRYQLLSRLGCASPRMNLLLVLS